MDEGQVSLTDVHVSIKAAILYCTGLVPLTISRIRAKAQYRGEAL